MIKQYNMRLVKWSARPSFALNRHKNHSGSSKGLSLTGFGVFFYKERDIFRKINLQCYLKFEPRYGSPRVYAEVIRKSLITR